MATGTGNLPNPNNSVLPFSVGTSEWANNVKANIDGLADGSAIGDGAISTNDLANGAVTAVKTSFGGNYTLTEVNTGFTWVDGKPIYKKTINFGNLPNNNTKTVAHSITGMTKVIDLFGIASGTNIWFPLPFVSNTAIGSQIAMSADTTNITVVTGSDRSGTTGYITIVYVK